MINPNPVIPLAAIGLVPMFPVIDVVPVVDIPDFARIAKLLAESKFTAAGPAATAENCLARPNTHKTAIETVKTFPNIRFMIFCFLKKVPLVCSLQAILFQ
jgi:hypothetical protein